MELSFGTSAAEVAVVGLGNPYCTDDGVGVAVVRALPPPAGCEVWESAQGSAYLAQSILGYSRVLIVDATSQLSPGEVRLGPLEEWERLGGERRGAHGMSLTRSLEMLRELNEETANTRCDDRMRVPEVWALAIGIPPDPPFGEVLSPQVAAAVRVAVEEVRGWLTK